MPRRSILLLLVLAAALAAVAARGAATDPSPPQRHLVLALLKPERIAAVDLDSGRVRQQRLPGGTLCRSPLLLVDGRILYVAPGRRGGRVMSVDPALSTRPRWIADADVVVPAADAGRVWLATRDVGPHGHWLVRQLTVVSGRTTLARETAPSLPILGAVPEGLVLGGRRTTWVWNPHTGRRSHATPGVNLLATQGSRRASCGGRCTTLLIGDGERDSAVHAPGGARFVPAHAAFSADGALAAVPLEPWRRPHLALVDVASATSDVVPGVRLGPYAPIAWSPARTELYLAGSRGRVLTYAPGAEAAQPLGVRFGDPIMQLLVSE